MRGAGLRLTTDVRRVWQCAVCGAERKVGAQVTTVRCQCEGRPAMKLVEAQRRERPLKELASPYLEFVFEPGELAAPRSQVKDVAVPTVDESPSDAATSAAMEGEVNEGGASPPEVSHDKSTQSQRPSRSHDRQGGRGTNPERAPQGRNEGGPRRDQRPPQRDQPPRKDQRGSHERRPDAPRNDAPAAQNAPPPSKPPRRQNDRQHDQPVTPPPVADNSEFGEGIHDDRSPESKT